MGTCIGRGTIISIILVLLVLPSILVLGDSIIERTSFKMPAIDLNIKNTSGTMHVQGHLRGYVSGVVDADFSGILHGQMNVSVSTDTQIKELPDKEDKSTMEGGDENA